jgi:hypothetical protein
MEKEVALVNRGRGLQLSTSRIAVHDVVPYFQSECSYDEIARWLPSLCREEIAILDRYYQDHKDELDEHARRVLAHRAGQIRLQKLRFPEQEGSRQERLAQLKQRLKQLRGETNGEGTRS